MIINEQEVKEFLVKNPDPRLVTASTIKDGYVSCIGIVPTICGAELICSPNTLPSLRKLIK